MLRAGHLHQYVVAGSLVTDDAVEIDDVTTVNADETRLVEPRFDIADGQRTKELAVAVEDVGVMGVGVDRDDVLNRHELRAAFALNRQMAGKPRRRRADAAERRIGAAAEFGIIGRRPRTARPPIPRPGPLPARQLPAPSLVPAAGQTRATAKERKC